MVSGDQSEQQQRLFLETVGLSRSRDEYGAVSLATTRRLSQRGREREEKIKEAKVTVRGYFSVFVY